MEKFLNVVRSNNMVQAVLCIAFGLFLMIYPSITVQGIIMLFGVALALMGAAGLLSYFRQRSVRYRDSGTLMAAVFYVIIAIIAFVFPKVIAGFFSVVRQQHLDRCACGGCGRGYRWCAYRGEPMGCVHDFRARARCDIRGQRRGRPVHRVVYPRFREKSRHFHASLAVFAA